MLNPYQLIFTARQSLALSVLEFSLTEALDTPYTLRVAVTCADANLPLAPSSTSPSASPSPRHPPSRPSPFPDWRPPPPRWPVTLLAWRGAPGQPGPQQS
jgi:hypothetical protein